MTTTVPADSLRPTRVDTVSVEGTDIVLADRDRPNVPSCSAVSDVLHKASVTESIDVAGVEAPAGFGLGHGGILLR